jgi:GntR family transcriptional regulator
MAPRAESRSRQIADALIEAITSAKYPIGATLPNEHQLCARFKVSRATVSVALRQLEELGLVYRRTRTGTQVVSRFPLKNQIEDGSVFHDWARYGVEYVFEVTRKEKPKTKAVNGCTSLATV